MKKRSKQCPEPRRSEPECLPHEGTQSCSTGAAGKQQETRKAVSPPLSPAQGSRAPSRAAVLQVWSPDQPHQHHPGTGQKSKFVGPTSELLNHRFWKWDPAICFNKSSRPFWCPLIFENLTTEDNQVTICIAFWKSSTCFWIWVSLEFWKLTGNLTANTLSRSYSGEFEKWLCFPIQSNRSMPTMTRNPLGTGNWWCEVSTSAELTPGEGNCYETELPAQKLSPSSLPTSTLCSLYTWHRHWNFISIHPLHLQTHTQIIRLVLLYLYSPILQWENWDKEETKWLANNPITLKGQSRVLNASRWTPKPPLLNSEREAAQVAVKSTHPALPLTGNNHLLTGLRPLISLFPDNPS